MRWENRIRFVYFWAKQTFFNKYVSNCSETFNFDYDLLFYRDKLHTSTKLSLRKNKDCIKCELKSPKMHYQFHICEIWLKEQIWMQKSHTVFECVRDVEWISLLRVITSVILTHSSVQKHKF